MFINAQVITPSDTANLGQYSQIYCGGDGNIRVTTEGGQTLTFAGVKVGDILPVSVTKVFDTGTTADVVIALW